MKKFLKYLFCISICITLLFALFGCGKSGGGGSSSVVSSATYAGSSSVSGTATASGADAASVSGDGSGISGSSSLSMAASQMKLQETMSPKKLSALAAVSSSGSFSGSGFSGTSSVLNAIGGGSAQLFAIGDDGSLIDTGFRALLASDGKYIFPGIKSGTAYVVRIIKEGTDTNGQANVLRLESMFILEEGEPTANCDVDAVEKMVMGFVLDEVIKYAQTTKISKRKIQKLQDAIYDAVIEMAQQGLITVPSAVTTKEEYQATTELLTDAFKAILNQLKTSKKVKRASKEVQAGAKASKLSSLTDQELKAYFADIMGMGGNQSPPDSFMKKFVEQFRLSKLTPLSDMVDGIYDSLIEEAKITANVASAENVKIYLHTASLVLHNELMSGLASLNAFEASGGITSNMSLFFPRLVTSNATEDEMLDLSDFVPLFQAAFPNPVTASVTADVQLTVPQALGYFGMIIPMGDVDDEEFDGTLFGAMYNYFGVNYPYVNGDDGGDMLFNPIEMLVSFGWISGTESFIENIDFRVNSIHIPQTMIATVNGKPSAIIADASVRSSDNNIMWKPVETLGLWFGYSSATNSPDEARLTYKKSNGVPHTVTFSVQSDGGSYRVESNSWQIFEKWKRSELPDSALSQIIVDFGEGTAYLTLWDDGVQIMDVDGDGTPNEPDDDVISATIMKPNMGSPLMLYPKGPDPVKVALYGWDHEFEPEEMPTNENGKARPLFEWQDPPGASAFLALEANSDLSLAYIVEIGMNINKIDWNQPWNPSSNFKADGDRPITPADNNGWRNIWSSWQDDTWIYGKSFVSPIDLEPTTKNAANNYETRYNVNIRPILIENSTRRTIWEGSGIWTEFYVGATDWTVALRGTIVFPERDVLDQMLYHFNPEGGDGGVPTANGSWKMGLFHMSGVESGGWNWQDYFWNSSDNTPRVVTGNGAFTVVSADITAATSYVSYSVPAITKASNLIKKNNEYSLVLWYDVNNDNSISVTGNNGDWVNFTEPTFRLDMGIHSNNGNVNYWANMDGQHRDGDLTLAENQIFNYNFADKLREWGWLNFLDQPYETGVSENWEDNNAQFEFIDAGDPELEFVKDPMVGRSQIRGWWNGSNGFTSVTAIVEAIDYIALVREWDQQLVATFDLTDTSVITANSGSYFVSINALEALISGNVTEDAYVLWGMVNGSEDPQWNSTMAKIDPWFRSQDASVTYSAPDLVWGFVAQNGLIYVGVKHDSALAGNDLTFAMSYNDGSDHILARTSRVNNYSLQQDTGIVSANISMFPGVDINTYDIFIFGDKSNYPSSGSPDYSFVDDLSSNGAWDTFISYATEHPESQIKVSAFLSTIVSDSEIPNADASGGRFDLVDMSYVQNVSQGMVFGKTSRLISPFALIGKGDVEEVFTLYVDNIIDADVATFGVYAKSDNSVFDAFPNGGNIHTNNEEHFTEWNWEVYDFNDFQSTYFTSMNPSFPDYFGGFLVTVNAMRDDYYIKAYGTSGKSYLGSIEQGDLEIENIAWFDTGSSIRFLVVDDPSDDIFPNYFAIADGKEDGDMENDGNPFVMAVATADADVSSVNRTINGLDTWIFEYSYAVVTTNAYLMADFSTLSEYDMVGGFVATPSISNQPVAYGVLGSISNVDPDLLPFN